jgi:hypothetical protein
MDFAALFVLAVLAGAGLLWVFAWVRRGVARHEDTWARAAQATGGQTDYRSGFLEGGMRVTANIGGVDVCARPTDADGDGPVVVRAAAPNAGALMIVVYRRGGLASWLRTVLSRRVVPMGEPAFDRDFVVKTNDAGRARSWLSADLRAHVRQAPRYDYRLRRGEAEARGPSFETDARALEAAMRAVALLAGR